MSVAYAVVIMVHRLKAHSPIRADNIYIPLTVCTELDVIKMLDFQILPT